MSYKATPEIKLKRFLYLSNENSVFVSGNPEIHNYYKKGKLTCISELFKDGSLINKDFVTNLFLSADIDPLLPRRDVLFFVLANFVTYENANDQQRHDFYSLVLNVCKSNEDLFSFIKFLSKIKKPFCSGVQKIISIYYLRQDAMDLIKNVLESNSYHGWTHKDLIKLVHCKTDNPVIEVILKYILYGDKRAVEVAADNVDALKVVEYIKKVKEYRTCNDEAKVAQFIPELNIRYVTQIPPNLMKSQMVWEALIPQLSLNNLISCLPKLYKMGFLKPGVINTNVIDILTNSEIIHSSHIHPVEVYIGLKNLEKGGKPKDPHLIKYLESKEDVEAKTLADPDYKKPNFAHQEPAKCTAVITALQKALAMSYGNVRPVSKRIMITIENSDKMNEPCLTTKNVTCLEAAAIVALSLFKANKVVTIAVFNGTTVTPIPVEKNVTLGQLLRKIKEAKHGTTFWCAPFDWAVSGNKQFDVFIHVGALPNFIDMTQEDIERDKPKLAFSSYMRKMNLPLTRLIIYCLRIHNSCLTDAATNILNLCGFDKNIPNIIEGVCKNLF